MRSLIGIYIFCLLTEFSNAISERKLRNKELEQCESTLGKIPFEEKMTITEEEEEESMTRLNSTWLSQECEIRAGPEYIVRKYSFFANGTFLLLRHYYAEESCSIATYAVVARGSFQISSPSVIVPGATEANVLLDSVRLIPFSREVAHTFGRRMRGSCDSSDRIKLRPYVAQRIYERPMKFSSNASFHVPQLDSNSHQQNRLSRSNYYHTLDCLQSLAIEFNELRLFRVVKKQQLEFTTGRRNRRDSVQSETDYAGKKIELLFGGLARNAYSKKLLTPNRLQTTALLRADTIIGCPICGSVFRGTEYNPPLFHQVPPLPAMIAGSWMSNRCESVEGGFWTRRFFRIYSIDNNRWFARWTYYIDATCSIPLFMVNAAGKYVKRAVEHPKENQPCLSAINIRKDIDCNEDDNYEKDSERIKSFSSHRLATVLSPSGTIELELRVTENLLLPVDKTVSHSCETTATGTQEHLRAGPVLISISLKSCRLRMVKASTSWSLKARMIVDWNGDYTLLLASREDDLWEAPLRRCSAQATSLQNYVQFRSESIRQRNAYERINRYKQHRWSFFSSSSVPNVSFKFLHIASLLLLCYFRFFTYILPLPHP